MSMTPEDLVTYLRDPETTVGDASLGQLVRLVNDLVDEYGPWGWPEPTAVTLVRLQVAARAWRNPEGITSRTESIDDHSETVRFERGVAGAGIFLTDDERSVLINAGAVPVEEPPWSGSLPYRR